MENLSLEEKIATFKKKIDELDPLTAPASGGPQANTSVPPAVEKEFKKEFEKGKIAAMKNKLVRKGLSVDPGGADAAAAIALDGLDEEERRPKLSDAEKTARLAAEFEKGKIAAMKNRLASKGLDLNTVTAAAEAVKAAGAFKAAAAAEAAAATAAASEDDDDSAKAPAVSNEQTFKAAEAVAATPAASEDGDDSAEAPAVSNEQTFNDAEAAAATAAITEDGDDSAEAPVVSNEQTEHGCTLDEIGESLSMADAVNGENGDVAITKPEHGGTADEIGESMSMVDAVNGKDDDVANTKPEHGGIVDEIGESPPTADAADGENDDVAIMTTEPKDEKEESPQDPSASDIGDTTVTESNDHKHDSPRVIPAEPSELPDDARRQKSSPENPAPAIVSAEEKGKEEETSSKVDVPPLPPATAVPDDADAALGAPVQDMNASPAGDPGDAAPTSTSLPATDPQVEGDTPERAPESCPKNEDISSAESEAGAPHAVGKEHALPEAQWDTQLQEGQHWEGELAMPDRKMGPSKESPEFCPKRGDISLADAQPSKEMQAGLPSSSKGVVAGRPQSEPRGAEGPESSPRETASPVTSPAPATRGLRTPSAKISPGPAAQRRRSPTGFTKESSTSSPLQQAVGSPARSPTAKTPAILMTPAALEESGKRLHDQARQSREKVERRRQEEMTSPLSPFRPRLWSTPRMGNPSLSGIERLDSLYRDAVERNLKMDMARRAAERPSECTFTPEISRKAANRKKEKRLPLGGESDDSSALEVENMSTFDALYLDAKRRRNKLDALYGSHLKEAIEKASPAITARGRHSSAQPLEVRLRENAERWASQRKDLEKRKLTLEQVGCTFSPSFYAGCRASAPRMRSRRHDSNLGGIMSFVERSDRFLAEREKNMERLKKEAMERERAEVTFRPRMVSSQEVDGAGAAGINVFERLVRAAAEQELNKSTRKKKVWKQERAKCNDFKPQLPSRSLESGSDPLNERIKKSTDEWIKNRAAREQRRRDLESEQCTFHPSLGSSKARRAAVDPRIFATSSRSLSSNHIAAPDAFAVRSAALQEAREERLEKMRKEKIKLELKEATFQPVTGNARRVKSGGGSADGTFSADAMVTGDPPAEGSEGADSGFAKPLEDDMSEAQRKFSSSEAKEPVDFKASMVNHGEEKYAAADRAVSAEAEQPEAEASIVNHGEEKYVAADRAVSAEAEQPEAEASMMNHGEEKYVAADRAVSAEAEQPEAEASMMNHGEEKYVAADRAVSAEAEQPEAEASMMNHGEEKYVAVDRAVSGEEEQPEAEVEPSSSRDHVRVELEEGDSAGAAAIIAEGPILPPLPSPLEQEGEQGGGGQEVAGAQGT